MLKENIHKIANFYGIDEQSQQCVEEMAELMQALSKYRRTRGHGQPTGKTEEECREAIITELADVKIMIYQIEYLLNGRDEIRKEIRRKVEREMSRMRRQDIRTCDNCLFEYNCVWTKTGDGCDAWQPESAIKKAAKEELGYTE